MNSVPSAAYAEHELHMLIILIDTKFAENTKIDQKCSCQLDLIHLFYLVACSVKIDDHFSHVQCGINMLQ